MRLPLVLAALACATPALAQIIPVDSARPPALGTVVVTAERAPTALRGSISSVTRLSAAELALTPQATLADVLHRASGFTVVDFDGLGRDPQLMVRGFYGGGEAEYVVVLIDGRPVNQLQSGIVAWDVLPPLASIEAVEIVRGSASPLYGDAAIGGVINVITRPRESAPSVRWDASGGSFGTWRADLDAASLTTAWPLAIGVGFDRTDGFRDHAARTSGRARAGVSLVRGPDSRLELSARSHWRKFEEPGPLFAGDRASSSPLFRFDETSDRSHALIVDGDRRMGARTRLAGSVGGEIRNTDAVRTLAFGGDFGDTKLRELASTRGAASVQLEIVDPPLPGSDWIVVGADLSHGTLDSKYFPVAGGTQADYEAATGERGELDARGDARRTVAALFAQYNLNPTDALRLALGARFDILRDVFRPALPDDVPDDDATHSAFSPRIGVNFRYVEDRRRVGNVYVTVSRSFKAPTLDQLYDLRSTPVPFPPFAIRTSNPALEPQHGTSIEAGVYHTAGLAAARRATSSLSVYQMDMKDELDFDVEAFRYVNIGRSRHRGIEARSSLDGARSSVFGAYALQEVTARSGENAGRRLKAVPRHTLSGGASVTPWRTLEASLLVTYVSQVYLDDANRVELEDHTRVDGRVSVGVRGARLFVGARNLLDREYSSTGFASQGGGTQLYPAAGRTLEIGVRGSW